MARNCKFWARGDNTCVSVFRQARRRRMRPIGVGDCVPCRTLALRTKISSEFELCAGLAKRRYHPGVIECATLLDPDGYDAFAFGSKGATFEALSDPSIASTPNSSASRLRRLATSPEISALADSTSRIAAKAVRRSSGLLGSNSGI